MYLEERMRALEDRIAALESTGRSDVDEQIQARLDSIETACQDLIEREEKFAGQFADSDRRLSDFGRQLEALFDQMAELDGRSTNVDFSPLEARLGQIETNLQQVRQAEQERTHRMGDLDQAVAAQTGKLTELDAAFQSMRDRWAGLDPGELQQRLAELDAARNEASTREARQNEQIQALSQCVEELLARFDGLEPSMRATETRQTTLEREAADLRKEVAWLRDRPQVRGGDNPARFAAAVGLAVAVAALVALLWPHETIQAQRFLVVDADGQRLAEFGSRESAGSLRLHGKSGKAQAVLAAENESATLTLHDPSGVERLRLAANSPGPEVSMFDAERTPRVRIIVDREDNGLRVYDVAGRLRVGVGLCDEGAAVNLFDPAEQRRIVLCSSQETSALAFLGDKEVQRSTLGVTTKDESILNFHDAQGNQRVLLFAGEKDAGVQILDRDTNVLFSGP